MPRRLFQLYAGLALYGVGIGLAVEAGLGLSPWDVLHEGLAKRVGLSIGAWVIIVGALVMLLWIPLRQRPGLGTVSNVIILGLVADATIALVPTPQSWPAQWFLLAAGVAVEAAATGAYIGAGFGPGPRDGLMTGLARRGLSIRVARTLVELSALAAGWLLGGTVGVGTLAFAFAIGPLTQVFMPLFARRPRETPAPAPAHP
ncbi:hypothetical protein D5H75_04735 [Bailinhaonella thermotolerans]|uniref:Integral membrane protein n=1 Tax=Bailinhaonella thermotolerans TaxID=1070861 RepID=A0A3A4BLJ5_9ACTN|nr:hypothetical protein D5H75_04735 [Bailinhaonella thermotolerans]